MTITIECPACQTGFPVDPAKIPAAGVKVRCAVCSEIFRVERPAPEAPAPPVAAPPVAAPPVAPAGFQFGKRDPQEKARRLARVLVSDMITYNPERHTRAIAAGTIEEDFEDEIKKSWSEYVDQIGVELAKSTDYWKDALNDILAGGKSLF